MGDSKRGFGDKEKMRTHMMFSATAAPERTRKAKRGAKRSKTPNALMHDATSQTPQEGIDPTQWTGNQRVLHFGPMASRDPYFYYFPKGWDNLYPAHFGFFPYRASKYRGSSPTICLCAFGVFFCIGGGVMSYVGFFHFTPLYGWPFHPMQIGGAVICALGVLFLVLGFFWWCCSLHLFNEEMRHTQEHHKPVQRTVRYKHYHVTRSPSKASTYRTPYQPAPPPVPPVLVNCHTEPSLYDPFSEMKVYPPSAPAYHSTLSLAVSGGGSQSYVGSPYNTLGSRYSNVGSMSFFENLQAWPEYHASKMTRFDEPVPEKKARLGSAGMKLFS